MIRRLSLERLVDCVVSSGSVRSSLKFSFSIGFRLCPWPRRSLGFSSSSSPSAASLPRRHPLLHRHLLPRRFGSPAVTHSSSAASAPPPIVGSPAVTNSSSAASAPPPIVGSPAVTNSSSAASAPPPIDLPPTPSSSPPLLRRRRRLQSILFRLHHRRR